MKMFIHREVGPLACNCYVVGDEASKEAIVIDPGGDAEELAAELAALELKVTAIVATHAHFDHIVAAEHLRQQTGAPFFLHADDHVILDWFEESGLLFLGTRLPPPPEVDTSPDEGDVLRAGSLELQVLHTPGHSPGSISLVAPEVVFAGDTLFNGSVGRTDLPGGDSDTLVRVIKNKLFPLGEDVTVYPGHGPPSTLGEEKRFNPFVGDAGGLWTPG
ncbi:MAG: MBL fold metallo-hydrolase [Actinomycetota bacterium]|nr:MBL fold metallo-hydrolase [Actinomycetota bacterium]